MSIDVGANTEWLAAPSAAAERELDVSQEDLLESRAAYVLRNDVIDAVMSVNPIIRAVHLATVASPIER